MDVNRDGGNTVSAQVLVMQEKFVEKVWLKRYPEGVPAEINPDQYSSLVDMFEASVTEFADQPAFVNMGQTITYRRLEEQSRAFAAYLQNELKLSQGDRVAVMMPNLLQYPIAVFGILRAGMIVVNVNPLYTPRELQHQLHDSGARAILILENFAHTLAQVRGEVPLETVIVTEHEAEGHGFAYSRDMETGQVRQIAANWDRSADSIQWSRDGQTIYTTAGDVGSTRLFAVDTRNGVVTPITGAGHVSAFQQTPSGFVFAQDSLREPGDLYFKTYLGREMPRRLTQSNPGFSAKQFGEYEQFSFAGWNNETVHGYVIKPAGYVEGRKYPVAFLIHGGPQGSFGNSWSYRWNPSTYAGAGYAVVMIDFHGSTGYGQAFTDAISQHWGDRPLEDLQKGWAAAQQKYAFLDGGKACALGASYGGYMINWIAGNWNEPWKCLVNHDGVFDTRSMGYVTEELWFTEWENGGTPFDKPENYEKFNPVNHVAKWRVPMLVVQGEKDYRVPVDQGLSTFTALQRKGIESKLLYFPDENHWVLKPQNSILWHDTVNAWLKQHIGR